MSSGSEFALSLSSRRRARSRETVACEQPSSAARAAWRGHLPAPTCLARILGYPLGSRRRSTNRQRRFRRALAGLSRALILQARAVDTLKVDSQAPLYSSMGA